MLFTLAWKYELKFKIVGRGYPLGDLPVYRLIGITIFYSVTILTIEHFVMAQKISNNSLSGFHKGLPSKRLSCAVI